MCVCISLSLSHSLWVDPNNDRLNYFYFSAFLGEDGVETGADGKHLSKAQKKKLKAKQKKVRFVMMITTMYSYHCGIIFFLSCSCILLDGKMLSTAQKKKLKAKQKKVRFVMMITTMY